MICREVKKGDSHTQQWMKKEHETASDPLPVAQLIGLGWVLLFPPFFLFSFKHTTQQKKVHLCLKRERKKGRSSSQQHKMNGCVSKMIFFFVFYKKKERPCVVIDRNGIQQEKPDECNDKEPKGETLVEEDTSFSCAVVVVDGRKGRRWIRYPCRLLSFFSACLPQRKIKFKNSLNLQQTNTLKKNTFFLHLFLLKQISLHFLFFFLCGNKNRLLHMQQRPSLSDDFWLPFVSKTAAAAKNDHLIFLAPFLNSLRKLCFSLSLVWLLLRIIELLLLHLLKRRRAEKVTIYTHSLHHLPMRLDTHTHAST